MAPGEKKKNLRLQKQSYSLDIPKENDNSILHRTSSFNHVLDGSKIVVSDNGPAWLRRSREKLGETPEYLIRTGSLKTKRIEDPQRSSGESGQDTSYVVQTGCYMWTGRSFHRDSYIVHRGQRKEGAVRKSVEHKTKNTEKNKSEGLSFGNRNDTIKCYEKPEFEGRSFTCEPVSSRHYKHFSTAHQITTVRKQGFANPSLEQNDDICSEILTAKLSRMHFPESEKEEMEKVPSNNFPCHNSFNHAQSLPPQPRKTFKELTRRMREQMQLLLEKQLEVDYEVVKNDAIVRDITAKLSAVAEEKEIHQFSVHVKELVSLQNLILGLAARLAKVEENLKSAKEPPLEDNSVIIGLEKKKIKLVEQLSEAQWIKRNIDKRSEKVERSLLKNLGEEKLRSYKQFVSETTKLLNEKKELSDKMKLCRAQMADLELQEGV